MEELRIYLNSMSPVQQKEFAERCGTSVGYLRKAISRNHELGAALCVLIETVTNQHVSRKHLRPENWKNIWPELVNVA